MFSHNIGFIGRILLSINDCLSQINRANTVDLKSKTMQSKYASSIILTISPFNHVPHRIVMDPKEIEEEEKEKKIKYINKTAHYQWWVK